MPAEPKLAENLVAALNSEWNSIGVDLGFRYNKSPVIVPDGTPPTPDDPSDYIQTARPGHRAPPAWLPDGRSTLDLFGHGFVLLRLAARSLDTTALVHAASKANVPLQTVDIEDEKISRLLPAVAPTRPWVMH